MPLVNSDFKYRIAHWDEQIKAGQGSIVKKEILKYFKDPNFKKMAAKNAQVRMPMASILRRVGQYDSAIKALYPLIRPSEKNPVSPSADSVIEYAASIIQNGGILEGRDLLNDIDANKFPLRNLYFAFSFFSEWDYKSAVPYLIQYLQHKSLSAYQILIGEVNLLAALVASENFEEAMRVLETLNQKLKNSENKLLLANCGEIEAQLYINNKDYQAAGAHLKKIEILFKDLGEPYSLYFQKWNTIYHLKLKEQQGLSMIREIADLEELNKKSREKHFFEVARDCDFWIGHFKKDTELLNFVYHGTPWKSFREKIIKMNPFFKPEIGKLTWAPQRVLPSVSAAQVSDQDVSLFFNSHQLPDKLIQILLSDFYAPWTQGRLFEILYPQEYYSPEFSHLKIHQLIVRARKKIAEKKLNLKIIVENKRCTFFSKRPLVFKKAQADHLTFTKSEFLISQFVKRWSDHAMLKEEKWFSISDLSEALHIPRRSCFELLLKSTQAGKVQKKGSLKTAKYCLIKR